MQPDLSPFDRVADAPKPDTTGQPTVTPDDRTVYREVFSGTTYVLGHFTREKEKQDE